METGKRLVLFDGHCPFCVGWVKFLLDRDGHNRLLFARLQSGWTEAFLRDHGPGRPAADSVLVWDGGTLRQGADALAAIAEVLPGIWQVGKHIGVLPEGMREGAYQWVAQRRHRIFGHYTSCWVPQAADRRKFVDLDKADKNPADQRAT